MWSRPHCSLPCRGRMSAVLKRPHLQEAPRRHRSTRLRATYCAMSLFQAAGVGGVIVGSVGRFAHISIHARLRRLERRIISLRQHLVDKGIAKWMRSELFVVAATAAIPQLGFPLLDTHVLRLFVADGVCDTKTLCLCGCAILSVQLPEWEVFHRRRAIAKLP